MNLQNEEAHDSELVSPSYAHFCSGTSFLGHMGTTALSRTAQLICFRGRAPTLHRALGIAKTPCIPVNPHRDPCILTRLATGLRSDCAWNSPGPSPTGWEGGGLGPRFSPLSPHNTVPLMGWLKQQESIVSKFQQLQVQGQDASRVGFS